MAWHSLPDLPACRESGILRGIALLYIEIFRGLPLMVQLFWLFFVLPHLGIILEPITTAVLACGLCSGAYGAEIVRGAVQAVPREQVEASIALNYTPFQRVRKVVVPLAVPAMLPPLGNQTIELLKSTALVSLITIQDLTFQGSALRTTTMRTIEVFSIVLVIYFMLAMIISLIFKLLEARTSIGLSRGGIR